MFIGSAHYTKDLNFLFTHNHARFLGIELFDHPALKATDHKLYRFHSLLHLEQYKRLDSTLYGKELPVYLKVSHEYFQTVLGFNILLDNIPSNYYGFCNFFKSELDKSLKRVEAHWMTVCKRFKWRGYSPFSFSGCVRDDSALFENTIYSDFPKSKAYITGWLYLTHNPQFLDDEGK